MYISSTDLLPTFSLIYPTTCLSSPIKFQKVHPAKHPPDERLMSWTLQTCSPIVFLISVNASFIFPWQFALSHIPKQSRWQILLGVPSESLPEPNHFSPPQLAITLLQAIISSYLNYCNSSWLLSFHLCAPSHTIYSVFNASHRDPTKLIYISSLICICIPFPPMTPLLTQSRSQSSCSGLQSSL